jgi:two-component system response regulator
MKTRILVIEDNPGDVELIRMALEAAGMDCDLHVIDEGEGAMAFVQRQPASADRLPDLVVLDLNLPKHSGIEILEALRGNQAFAAVPVTVLSSSSSRRDRAKIEDFKIAMYITKPPDLEEFMKIGPTLKTLVHSAPADSANSVSETSSPELF